MTEETKKLFSAPWEADVCCEIHDKNESLICICCPGEPHIANRLVCLPELYSELKRMVNIECLNACERHGPCDQPCKVVKPAIELLRKVRAGE